MTYDIASKWKGPGSEGFVLRLHCYQTLNSKRNALVKYVLQVLLRKNVLDSGMHKHH